MLALDACACSTTLIIWDNIVSSPIAVAFIINVPDTLTVAPMTWLEGPFSTGTLSPVSIASSTVD